MEWTSDQKKAIEESGSDILVSAAAGSGKTAVLVERIIRKLLDEENPIDIDRMLVVTFTEAAAAEMKEKIIRALQKSGSERADKQLRLAADADIMTIDSFCLKCVRNNFHNLGIDPEFGLCDSAEAELMKEETCEALFDALYRSENEEDKQRFIHLTELYSSNRNDYNLRDMLFVLYKFTRNFAEPDKWLDNNLKMYDEELFQSVWVKDALDRSMSAAEYYGKLFKKLTVDMAAEYGFEGTYEEVMRQYPPMVSHTMSDVWGKQWDFAVMCAESANEIKEAYCSDPREMWDKLYLVYRKMSQAKYFPNVRKSGKMRENDKWDEYNERRKQLFNSFRSDTGELVMSSADETERRFKTLGSSLADIIWLLRKFDNLYMALKEKRGAYEFHDIEHMTYRLFCNEDIRNEYKNMYDEILIDEYQDTNGLQDAIFGAISENNMFMVGDLKQSIYRFRGGDPFIFKKRSAEYLKGEGGVRIALSQNFRSRREILDSVNSVFGGVMSDRVGDVVYEGDECLCREKDYYTENGCDHKSEFHIIPVISDSGDDVLEDIENERLEAAHIAAQIRSMLDNGYRVFCGTDEDGNAQYRNMLSRDVAILASSVRNIADIYTEELEKQGIAAYVENNGYFDRKEVKLMLSLLSLINNVCCDIPLIAVMRSPIGGFSDDELSKIRMEAEHTEYFYDAVKRNNRPKCKNFINMINRWREYMKYKNVAGLLWSIYEESGFYDFMGAFEGGAEAQANLRLLYERAKEYEESDFKGLFNFIKYIERMENRAEDMGAAKIIGENHDVVRIMTIHKSKGLEFPVVFLAGAGKRNSSSSKNEAIKYMNLHKDGGIGLMYVDSDKGYYTDTPAYRYIKRICREERQSENLRKLYVGLTRPKEKLIVTAVMKFASEDTYSERMKNWKSSVHNGKMDEETSVGATGFFDWLIPVALNNPSEWEFKRIESTAGFATEIYRILNYKYPYSDYCRLPSKTTVTEIKRLSSEKAFEPEYTMSEKPKFALNAEEAAAIGTAHHQVMAYIRMKKGMDEEYVKEEVSRICDMGEISREDAENISTKLICDFFNGGLGSRMAAAYANGRLHREAPFEIAVGADVYNPMLSADNGDEIIVQGAIDCYFEESDGIVLVDYKTDRLKGDDKEAFANAKAEEYAVQLELYKKAIEKILKKPVTEAYLYLFSINRAVRVF